MAGAVTPGQNATYGTPAGAGVSPPSWVSYYRYPGTIDVLTGNVTVAGVGALSLLVQPTSQSVPLLSGLHISPAMRCGFSTNMVFSLADIPASSMIPWVYMYRYIRVKRIHVKVVAPRTQRVTMVQPNLADDPYIELVPHWNSGLGVADNSTAALPNNSHGGQCVFMCTRRTGPIVEQMVGAGVDDREVHINRSGYGIVKNNPQFRKRAQFRNDVSYGMRPVKFSFRPTVLQPRFSLGQASTLSELLTGHGAADAWGRIQGSEWRYKSAPWLKMSQPSSSAQASAGNTVSIDFRAPDTNDWWSTPYFGFYAGMAPYSCNAWPRNMRCTVSMDVEFSGVRNVYNTAATGGADTYFMEWGNAPVYPGT